MKPELLFQPPFQRPILPQALTFLPLTLSNTPSEEILQTESWETENGLTTLNDTYNIYEEIGTSDDLTILFFVSNYRSELNNEGRYLAQ